MPIPILRADDIVKRFASVTAVDHVSFAVRAGEILALLGPNGAGKTTLVRMLTGILEPDAGRVTWALDGTPAEPDRARIGFLPEERGLYQDVPILRTLAYFGALRGMPRAAAEAAGREWLDRLGLVDRAKELVKTLSKGNQQKVQFAGAVLHRPRFVILDEPFSGLDPLNQELFLDLIRGLRDEGATVLLCAHQMDLVERLADRLVLMNRGRRVEEGTVEELRVRWGAGHQVLIHFSSGDPARLARVPGAEAVESLDERTVRVRVRPGASMSELLAAAAGCLEIDRVHSEQARLHEIYLSLMGGGVVPAREGVTA